MGRFNEAEEKQIISWYLNKEMTIKEIAEYYFVAPQIVTEIKKRADSIAIFDSIYEKLVKPCVDMIERGENENAHVLYRATVQQLQLEYLA